jgi:hypothetical protein
MSEGEGELDAEEPIRILVCGTRNADCEGQVLFELQRYHRGQFLSSPVVVHGGCPNSADVYASKWAKAIAEKDPSVSEERHPADWDKHGKAAGFIRNAEMANAGANICFAFWDGRSRGTLDMITRATLVGIPVRIVPVRVRRDV